MYGLAAMGGWEAAAVLLQQVDSDAKWRRKAAVFALGEGAPLTAPVVEALCRRLAQESSVYVRAVAAAALGCREHDGHPVLAAQRHLAGEKIPTR